jgi:hypothetical protein
MQNGYVLQLDALNRIVMKRYGSRDGFDELEVTQPLLQQHGLDDVQSDVCTTAIDEGLSYNQLAGVYMSHFLSTWNSRCYEFAAVSDKSSLWLSLMGYYLILSEDPLHRISIPRDACSVFHSVGCSVKSL